jgi:thioredoxin 1
MDQTAARPIVVTDAEFPDKVLESDRPVLVDFWAEWCAPCRALGPIMESLADEYGDRVTVAKLDIDANHEAAMRYGIRSIPTVMLFADGEVVDTFIGVRPKNHYTESLDRALG